MTVEARGPALVLRTCARRLRPLGATVSGGDGDLLLLEWEGEPDLAVDVSWFGPAAPGARRGSEEVVQAASGLMAIHGRDAGAPRRLGLEIASVAAGVLAAHALVAAAVGRRRGVGAPRIQSSVLEAALLIASHRIAAASTGSEWVPAPDGPEPGPPFVTADGHRVEIETLDPAVWRTFWERLGLSADLGWAWKLFRTRYFRGTCTLPAGLHATIRRHSLGQVGEVARECGVSLVRVRTYDEVLADPGFSEGHPVPRPLAGEGRARGAPVKAGATLPLEGITVVEATTRLQGPLASLLLQALGARVVKVEPPGGDLSRSVEPLAGDTGSFYLSFNRGKEPVELDLARPAGRAELVELLSSADVFLQNWRPGKAAEWGLEADDLARANPGLVYVHGSGWGELDEMASAVGTDYMVQAYAGVGAGIEPDERAPSPSRALVTDYMGALVTCEAMLTGLYLREREGRGWRVGASLLQGAMALQAHVLQAMTDGSEKGRRRGRPLWGRLDHPLAAADGHLVVTVASDDDLEALCLTAGVDLAGDGVEAAIAERIASGAAGEWERRLSQGGLPSAVARTDLGALPDDPRLSGMFEPLPAGASVPRTPWRLG